MRNPTVSIPIELADAIDAEAWRTGRQRHEILVDWLRRTWPSYVAGRITADFAPVIDVEPGHAETRRCPALSGEPTTRSGGQPPSLGSCEPSC